MNKNLTEQSKEKVDPNTTQYNYLLENNKNFMNYTALTFGNRKITYEELHDKIDKYARALYKRGIREGDKIAVCALNTPESVYLLYALNKLGAIVVGLSPLNNEYKMKRDLEIVRPKMVITIDNMYSNIRSSEESLNFSTVLYSPLESIDNRFLQWGYKYKQIKQGNYILSKSSNLKKIIKCGWENDVKYAEHKEGKLTDIMFTGGSTAIHKGVDLSGEGLNYVVEGMNAIFDAVPGLIHLGNIPIGHMVYGRLIMHYSLCNNFEFAMTLKATTEDFYDELVRTKANAAVGGPPHWSTLIAKDEKGNKIINPKLKKGSLSHLMYATSGGEASKIENVLVENKALAYCGSSAKMGDGLGTTEMWATVMINNGKKNTTGTIGTPLPTVKVKVVDPNTGLEVKEGQPGVLHVAGPSLMLGYHNNKAETEEVIYYDENGIRWYNMGDIVKRTKNAPNEYSYIGRQKRNFVCGMDNVYPEEIESILLQIPEIKEVVVTKIPDEELQYYPKYHISVNDFNFDTKDLENRINVLITSTLGKSALPGEIEYTDSPLKRMDNTKIDIQFYQDDDIRQHNRKIREKNNMKKRKK